MLDALITGRLHGKPTQKAAKTGKPFAIAKVRVATGDQAIFVSVVAFDAAVCNGLLALDEGDSVALAGTLTPTAWLDREGAPRPGMDMVAHALLTAYHVKRKRAAQAEAQQPRQQREPLDDFEARQGLGDWWAPSHQCGALLACWRCTAAAGVAHGGCSASADCASASAWAVSKIFLETLETLALTEGKSSVRTYSPTACATLAILAKGCHPWPPICAPPLLVDCAPPPPPVLHRALKRTDPPAGGPTRWSDEVCREARLSRKWRLGLCGARTQRSPIPRSQAPQTPALVILEASETRMAAAGVVWYRSAGEYRLLGLPGAPAAASTAPT